MGTYENSAGLGNRNHYGPRALVDSENFGGQVSTGGFIKQAVWEFDFDNLPVNSATGGQMETEIPAGSIIMGMDIEVITAMSGSVGTYAIGLEEDDGTTIDLDGLGTAAEIIQADLVDNAVLSGTGALIGTQIDVDAQLIVVEGGSVSAGRYRVVVEYRQANFDASTRYTAGGVKA